MSQEANTEVQRVENCRTSIASVKTRDRLRRSVCVVREVLFEVGSAVEPNHSYVMRDIPNYGV